MISRAEEKLTDAAKAFDFDFRGKVVMDIGSSTGGFTNGALKLGAKKVIAIEKGTRQMKAPLKFDARVELFEKTDIFEVDPKLINEVEVILADVSFVSLKEVLLSVSKKIKHPMEFLVMLKPQFEARPDQLVKGVVKNERMRREIIKNFEQWLKGQGFVIKDKRDNRVVGKNGNIERFYLLTFKNLC